MHWPALGASGFSQKPSTPRHHYLPNPGRGAQLQGALTGWVARVVADQEVSVDGKWAKQSEDANGTPMVNVLAHDLRLMAGMEKRYEPGVLQRSSAIPA